MEGKRNVLVSLALSSIISLGSLSGYAQNDVKSINVLEFGPDNVLFVGDSKSGSVHAFSTETVENPTMQYGYNIKNLDVTVASFLGTTPENILIKDLAVHPATKEAYVAVSRISGKTYQPAIVILDQSGSIRKFNMGKAGMGSATLQNEPAQDFKFWEDVSASELTFTDIDFYKGKLYISGLSNSDFASTLRVVDYPFEQGASASISVEIFHTNHGQNETRAPIRTLEIVELAGKEYVIAAYTCTPLVTIPLSDLKDGAHVTGKTIAELGFGNTPIDLISFMAQDMQENKYPVVYLSNKNQSAQVIPLNQIEEGINKDGLSSFANFQKAGVQAFDVPVTSTLQVADQDGYHLLTARRNMDNGHLELVSVMKNLYFRLSDFQSEFEFPDYTYPKGSEFFKGVQNMMKQDEGFAHKVVK